MASLERHAQPRKDGTESVAWRVRWADATTSRPVKKSFPTQEQAQAFLERVAPGEAHGSGLPHIAELRRPAQPADVDPLEEYLRWCAHLNLAVTTIAQKRTHLRRLSHWLGEQSDHPGLLEVTGDHLRTWQLSLSGKAVQTRRSAATHARAFYRYAGDMELADHRLVGYLRIPHVPARLPRPISADDLASALAGAPPRIKPWLLIAAYTGARACEIAPLRAEDVDLRGSTPTVRIHHAKGSKQRVVPLAPQLVEALLRCDLPFRGWLFPGQDRQRQPTGGHVTASQVSHLASRYLHETGSPSTFHALRHHFGTEVYRGSLDIRLTQDLLGHSSPAMTAGYTALAPGRAVDVVGQVAGSIGVAHRAPMQPRPTSTGWCDLTDEREM